MNSFRGFVCGWRPALQAVYRQTAVNQQHCAGGIGQLATGQQGNSAPHILRRSPTLFKQESCLDQSIVLAAHACCHVRVDNAGAYLIHTNAVRSKAHRPQPRSHRDARLRDAIVAAVHACDGGRDGTDVDDGAMKRGVARLLSDHPSCNRLGEEVGSFEIRRDQLVEALFMRVKNVGAHTRSNACVVDQHVQPAESLLQYLQEPRTVRAGRYIRLHVDGIGAEFSEAIDCGLNLLWCSPARNCQSKAGLRQLQSDPQANAASAASYQSYLAAMNHAESFLAWALAC